MNLPTDEPELAITTFLHSIRSSTSIVFLSWSFSFAPPFIKTTPFISLLIRSGGTPAACDDEVTFFEVIVAENSTSRSFTTYIVSLLFVFFFLPFFALIYINWVIFLGVILICFIENPILIWGYQHHKPLFSLSHNPKGQGG